MLVLTRRLTESLKIGKEITVTILGVSGNQVRIGIEAPKDVTVDREEIWEKKQRELANTKPSSESRREA